MSKKELLVFRDILMAGRGEILDRIQMLTSALRSLNEHEIEIEESVQKSVISNPYDRLGKDGRMKIELIDLALRKIAIGEYGICESCGDDISVRRLEAVPWTRLCIDCAREQERKHDLLPSPSEVVTTSKLPEEYQGLSNDELKRLISEQISRHLEADRFAMRVSIINGVIHQEGTVPNEIDRQMILQVLSEDMGFEAVVDLMEVEMIASREENGRIADSLPFSEPVEDMFV